MQKVSLKLAGPIKAKHLLAIILLFANTAFAFDEETRQKLELAVDDSRRGEHDKSRDANRLPIETLQFFGFRQDMKVLELMPGQGWYTNILAPVLEENGKLYISVKAEQVYTSLNKQAGFSSLALVPFDDSIFLTKKGVSRFGVPEFSFGLSDLDMALTFRNLHNFNEEGRDNLNKAVFHALKSGGIYGVIDHTRRHMQGDDKEVWRRSDPVKMIKEIESAGFQFVDYADIHHRPDDQLIYEVGRSSVSGNTDRFTFLFRKP